MRTGKSCSRACPRRSPSRAGSSMSCARSAASSPNRRRRRRSNSESPLPRPGAAPAPEGYTRAPLQGRLLLHTPRTLICGSLAFDTIMVFPDRFARHILPEQTHILSVSFQIAEMRREWGGCAGNMAYNLKALGGDPVVMATLGADGAAYRERLAGLGIDVHRVRPLPPMFTAQAF